MVKWTEAVSILSILFYTKFLYSSSRRSYLHSISRLSVAWRKDEDKDICFLRLSTKGKCANKQPHISILELFPCFPSLWGTHESTNKIRT